MCTKMLLFVGASNIEMKLIEILIQLNLTADVSNFDNSLFLIYLKFRQTFVSKLQTLRSIKGFAHYKRLTYSLTLILQPGLVSTLSQIRI